jgi:hypothetical protein
MTIHCCWPCRCTAAVAAAAFAQVRIAACAALVAFVASAGSSYCSTNSGYLAAGVVLHMDDGDQEVAEAACQVRKPHVFAVRLQEQGVVSVQPDFVSAVDMLTSQRSSAVDGKVCL